MKEVCGCGMRLRFACLLEDVNDELEEGAFLFWRDVPLRQPLLHFGLRETEHINVVVRTGELEKGSVYKQPKPGPSWKRVEQIRQSKKI